MATVAAALAFVAAFTLRAEPPPLLPDWQTAQLYEGCAVQADSYARQLKALDPSWDVQLATLTLPNGSKHSVAITRRDSESYIRDSVLGVFPLEQDLQATFHRRMRAWRSEHPLTTPNASRNYRAPDSEAATAAAVEIAARSLGPDVTNRYLVSEGKNRFWVIAWTTVDGKRALYHPRIGTTLTETRGSSEKVAIAILRALGCKRPTLIGSSQR
jgi:hypothetical protein